jgi:hypothetical protein
VKRRRNTARRYITAEDSPETRASITEIALRQNLL